MHHTLLLRTNPFFFLLSATWWSTDFIFYPWGKKKKKKKNCTPFSPPHSLSFSLFHFLLVLLVKVSQQWLKIRNHTFHMGNLWGGVMGDEFQKLFVVFLTMFLLTCSSISSDYNVSINNVSSLPPTTTNATIDISLFQTQLPARL